MEAVNKITSKGQFTLPKGVRDALGLASGDTVVLRVEGGRATLAAMVDLLDLAGSVSVPVEARGLPWDDVRRRAWRDRCRGITS